MIKFLDFFDLHLQIIQFSDNISDELIKSIIYDDQFKNLNYDYDILFIIDKIGAFNQQPAYNKSLTEIETWIENFINQLQELSKYTYSEEEILILQKYLLYKLLLKYHLLTTKISNIDVKKQYINNILEALDITIPNNCSAWLAKEQLRRMFLEFFLFDSSLMTEYLDNINEQLQIARNNEVEKNELESILDTIQIR